MSIKLKSKKINMIIQYNNFFEEESRCCLTAGPTEEKFLYSPTEENKFINTMAYHNIGNKELIEYIEQQKNMTLKK